MVNIKKILNDNISKQLKTTLDSIRTDITYAQTSLGDFSTYNPETATYSNTSTSLNIKCLPTTITDKDRVMVNIDEFCRKIIIDIKDLPSNFECKINDVITLEGSEYIVKHVKPDPSYSIYSLIIKGK